MLWTWVILCLITYGVSFINAIVDAAKGHAVRATVQFLSVAIMAFAIYCVHRRINDVKINQQLAAAGQGYKQGKLHSSPDV